MGQAGFKLQNPECNQPGFTLARRSPLQVPGPRAPSAASLRLHRRSARWQQRRSRRDELSLAFKRAARAGPSSPSYEQALCCRTAAWPAAPRAGHPAGSKAVRGTQEPDGHIGGTHSFIHQAAPRRSGPERHERKRGGYGRCAPQPSGGWAAAWALSSRFASCMSAV